MNVCSESFQSVVLSNITMLIILCRDNLLVLLISLAYMHKDIPTQHSYCSINCSTLICELVDA